MSDNIKKVQQQTETNEQMSIVVSECSNQSLATSDEASPLSPSLPLPSTLPPTLPSRIFKLNIDCFEELFVWLSFKELLVLRGTCKQFKKVVDYYIKAYYPAVKMGYGHLKLNRYRGYLPFIDPKIIKLIKEITYDKDLCTDEISTIKEALSLVEVLNISNCEHYEYDFFEVFLKFCPKLKCLSINEVSANTLMSVGNEWLLRQYPLLEHFVLRDDIDAHYDSEEITQLETFFRINPNIRTFSTTLHCLWVNRNWLIGSDIQFDQLDVEHCSAEDFDVDDIDNMFGLVHELYQNGLFKKLHFYGMCIYDQEMFHISTLPALEKMHLREVNENLIVPSSLKVLHLDSGIDIKNPEALAKNISNVERIYIRNAESTDILPFIRLSASVTEIRITNLGIGTHFQNDIINLVALNQERQELHGAKKLTIYANEQIYLTMKWAGIKTNRSLVQLRRAEECDRKMPQPFSEHIYADD